MASDSDNIMCMQVFGDDPTIAEDGVPVTNTPPDPNSFGDVRPLIAEARFKWDEGTQISIKFLEPCSVTVENMIKKYGEEWLQYTGLPKYTWLPQGSKDDAMVRIAFSDQGKSWSMVGKNCLTRTDQSKATMNFGWFNDQTTEDEFRRTTLHEFGHMLGCVHEQFSPGIKFKWNEKAVIAAFTNPNQKKPWTEKETRFNFNDFKPVDETKYPHTTWDPDSIMHYGVKAAWTTGPWIGPDGQQMDHVKQKNVLSKLDKQFINWMYPKH